MSLTTISSVSGGKTSSMMALEFPTDRYIFAVVLSDHEPSAPRDKGLLRECQNRIPHFVASHEADLTLSNMLRLEQEIGQKIDWVAAEFSLEKFALGQTSLPGYRSGKPLLPNKRHRFCTTQAKILPIFWHCYLNYFDGDPLLMNIGFRWDEVSRTKNWSCENDKIHFPESCNVFDKKQKHKTFEWRISQMPMYEARIDHRMVKEFWKNKGWQFPEISNCRFCFNHTSTQQQRQAILEPANLQAWLEMESVTGKTFQDAGLADILRQPLLDVYGSGEIFCSGCTD